MAIYSAFSVGVGMLYSCGFDYGDRNGYIRGVDDQYEHDAKRIRQSLSNSKDGRIDFTKCKNPKDNFAFEFHITED